MGKILVENIRVFAYHGCIGEEAIIGSEYKVNVTVYANLTKSAVSDQLSETVDYTHLNRIVKEEMQQKSKLLEHVCRRILRRILQELSLVEKVQVSVSKLNPPISGDVEAVTVVLKEKRGVVSFPSQ